MRIKPIETKYAGYRFRSRLEARWAVFFDALNLEWEYEPERFETSAGWYLPDFYVHNWESYVEIKGVTPNDVELRKLRAFAESYGFTRFFLLMGNIPLTIKESPNRKNGYLGIHMYMPAELSFAHIGRPVFNDFVDNAVDRINGALIAARSARF